MTTSSASRPIVVAVESQQHGAIRYALDEAGKQHCDVRIVHAYAIPATGVGVLYGNDLVSASEKDADEVLDGAREFIESQATGVKADYSAQIGAPTRVLQDEALHARAIVLGPDALAWYDRLLVGEVGSWLITHADCPVLVVPEHWLPRDVRREGIVVTIDGATDAHGPLSLAFAAADRSNEYLHVVHVVPPATSENDEEEHRLNMAEVIAGWSEKYPSVRVRRSLLFGEVDEACISATRLANLVVAGRPRRHGLPFSLLRPVAASIIKEADCPVAVVPSNYDG